MSDPGMIKAGKKAIEKRDGKKEKMDPKPAPLPKKTGEAIHQATTPGVQHGKEPSRASGSPAAESAGDPNPVPQQNMKMIHAATEQMNTPGVQNAPTPSDHLMGSTYDDTHANAMKAHAHAMAAHAHRMRSTATGGNEMGREPQGF